MLAFVTMITQTVSIPTVYPFITNHLRLSRQPRNPEEASHLGRSCCQDYCGAPLCPSSSSTDAYLRPRHCGFAVHWVGRHFGRHGPLLHLFHLKRRHPRISIASASNLRVAKRCATGSAAATALPVRALQNYTRNTVYSFIGTWTTCSLMISASPSAPKKLQQFGPIPPSPPAAHDDRADVRAAQMEVTTPVPKPPR